MCIFLGSKRDILSNQRISPISVHKLDGSLHEEPGLKLDECLKQGVLLLRDEEVCCLRFDNVVDKIGICKQCHLIRLWHLDISNRHT